MAASKDGSKMLMGEGRLNVSLSSKSCGPQAPIPNKIEGEPVGLALRPLLCGSAVLTPERQPTIAVKLRAKAAVLSPPAPRAPCKLKPAAASPAVLNPKRFTPSSPSAIKIHYPVADHVDGSAWETLGMRLDIDPDKKKSKMSCVLGLDFGTAYTKACVRVRGASVYVVSWMDAVRCDSEFFLPGTLTVLSNSTCVLGNVNGGKIYDRLKMKLLEENSQASQVIAVAFLALATRYVRGWLFSRHRSIFQGFPLDWFLNVGLPSVPWESAAMRIRYRSVCAAGWRLGATNPTFAALSRLPTR